MREKYHQVFRNSHKKSIGVFFIIFLVENIPVLLFSQNQTELIFKEDNTPLDYIYVFDSNNNYLGASDNTGKITVNYKGKIFVKSFLYNDTCVNIKQNHETIFLTPKINVLPSVKIKSKIDPCKTLIVKILKMKEMVLDTSIYYHIKYSTFTNDWEENFNAIIQITYKHQNIKNIIICDYNYDYNYGFPDSIYNSFVLFTWEKDLKNIGLFLNKHKLKKICSHSSFSFNNYKNDSISILVENRSKLYYEFFRYNFFNKNLFINSYGYTSHVLKFKNKYYDNSSAYYKINFNNYQNVVLLNNFYAEIKYTLHLSNNDFYNVTSSVELQQVKNFNKRCKQLNIYNLLPKKLYDLLNFKTR